VGTAVWRVLETAGAAVRQAATAPGAANEAANGNRHTQSSSDRSSPIRSGSDFQEEEEGGPEISPPLRS